MTRPASSEFKRPSLRAALRQSLKTAIIRGQLPASSHLVEANLCSEWGVSRTPLREALISLEREGFVSYDPGRGFFVCPLFIEEAREIYPIIDHLEQMAVRLSPTPDPDLLRKLERINLELAATDTEQSPDQVAEARVRLDRQWHQTLVRQCPNDRLRELIEQLYERASRYEYGFWLANGDRPFSVTEHQAIAKLWSDGDMDRALIRMTEHWQAGLDLIADQLSKRHVSGLGN